MMANIPLGNFGNVMPQAQAGRVLDTGSQYIGQAVSNLGQTGQQLANKELKEQQRLQDEKDEYSFNIEAAKYGSDYTDYVTETKQRLALGELDEVGAKSYLRQRTDELKQAYSQTLPKTKQEKFEYYSERMFYDSQNSVKPIAFEAARNKINADFSEMSEATLKIEDRIQAYSLFKDTLERNPMLTPEQRVKSEQQWQERRDLTEGKAALRTLEEGSDIEGLAKFKDSIDNLLPYLKVEARDAFKSQTDNAINRINKAQQIEQEKNNKQLDQLVKDFTTQAYTGYPLSASTINSALEASQGTEQEARIREAIALNKAAVAFRDKSPIEQEREIARLTTQLESTEQDDAVKIEKQLNLFQSIANATKQRSKDDPLSQLQSQTKQVFYSAPVEQIGSGGIDFKQAEITTQTLADQKKKNGGVGSLIQWNTSERNALTQKFNESTPNKQVSMLVDLGKMGGSNNEAKLEYYSLINGKENAPLYVGITALEQKGAKVHGTNISIPEVALEGVNIENMKQGSILINKDAFRQALVPHFGNKSAVGTLERKTYENLAYSIALGLAKREGGIKTDDKGNPLINKDLVKRSFTMATGGTYHQKVGNNTNTIYRPYGTSTAEFEEILDERVSRNYFKDTGKRMERGFLKSHAIESVPNYPNWIRFRNPDGSIHINQKTKQPYVIKIN